MSSAGRWSYVNDVTVWPAAYDSIGQPTYGAPYLIKCDWRLGGSEQLDNNGNRFSPESMFWFELALDAVNQPKREDKILLGDHTAQPNPPSSAEIIRKVIVDNAEQLKSGDIPDWKLMT